MKVLTTKSDVKASAIYALKSGVNVKSVKTQLKEHGITCDNVFTRSKLIVHLENN